MKPLAYIFPVLLVGIMVPGLGMSALGKPADLGAEDLDADTYVYQSEGKRNPFALPPGLVGRQPGEDDELVVLQKKQRDKELLESFPLDSLKLVAILLLGEGQLPVAMVQDPEGKGHLLRPGNYIGANEGKVTEIVDGKVIITEPVAKSLSKESTRTITLLLHKEDVE